MADIARWDPFSEMSTIRQTMDRLFDERPWRVFNGGSLGAAEGYFPVDVYETNDEVVVKASLPGVKPEDINVSVTGQLLTLKAETKDEQEHEAKAWYRREHKTGAYLRQFTLPAEVESDKTSALFDNGVLKLTLPKAEAMKPRQIKVQAANGAHKMIEGKAS
jgi:HSP20 family protein